jgi:DNA-binding transcriptional ArsR family regulator
LCDIAWIAGRAVIPDGLHLRVLRAAGLARSRRDGKVVFYALTDAGRVLVDAHVEQVRAVA